VLRDVPAPDGSAGKTSLADDGATLRHCEVVDGQQRLTTCLLLLDRVRRRVEQLEDGAVPNASDVARRIRSTYGMVGIDNALEPRPRLGSGLNSYWVDTVLGDHHFAGPAPIAGQERLREACAFFDAKLDQLATGAMPTEEFERLRELQRRATAGLGFLVYDVQSVAEVGVIFETLNERGRDLSELEKAKNYLLYLARSISDSRGEQLAQIINEAWAQIFMNLASEVGDADDQLLRAHWLATQNPDRGDWKRIASIKSRFDRSNYISGETRIVPVTKDDKDQSEAWDRLFADVSAYVTSLRDCSFFLAEMFDPEATFASFTSHRDDARARSGALRRSGVVALYRPLLFAARLRHPADGALYARLVDLCERFSARVFVIEQRRANAGEPRLLRLANDLFAGADPDHVCREVSAVLWRYAPDDRIRETLEATSANWYGRRGHKYFLYEYELSIRVHGQELQPLTYFTDVAKEQRTTEHVLPQHPDADANCWWGHFSPEQHAALVHSLGNLALTYDNSVYSNKCFDLKRGHHLTPGETEIKCYAQATLKQEQRLASVAEWTPEAIKERQHDLATWALQRWSIDPPTTAELTAGDVDIETEGSEEDAAQASDGHTV